MIYFSKFNLSINLHKKYKVWHIIIDSYILSEQNKCKPQGSKCEDKRQCCDGYECRGMHPNIFQGICQLAKPYCMIQGETCVGISESCCAGLRCSEQGVCKGPKIELSGNKATLQF